MIWAVWTFSFLARDSNCVSMSTTSSGLTLFSNKNDPKGALAGLRILPFSIKNENTADEFPDKAVTNRNSPCCFKKGSVRKRYGEFKEISVSFPDKVQPIHLPWIWDAESR